MMKIKLLDGSKCKDFSGDWVSSMEKYIGLEISKEQDWVGECGVPKYREADKFFEIWTENGNHYWWDKRCVEILEDNK